MPKVFHCSKCALQHPRPVGKKCKYEGEFLSDDVEVAAPPSMEPDSNGRVSQLILSQLQQLGEKMDLMDRRMQRTEAALGQGTSQASLSSVTSHSASTLNVPSHGVATERNVESVVPSLGYLRSNDSVQAEVDKRLAELTQLNESATKGRIKSQRGGPGDVTVKRVVDWPQNFILTGSHKVRPSYDDLTMSQWVSGFVRCIQEEKSEAAKSSMLDYLDNLMEDASDFSWESAKASHAIVLTNMEADRLQWTETEKLDHIRRAHAQRHNASGSSNGPKSTFHKKAKNLGSKMGLSVAFFKRALVNFPPTTGLLVSCIGTSVNIVMGPTSVAPVPRKLVQKN